MSQINSLRAYTDCEKLFAAALADPKGARAMLNTQDACINMRTRMHYYRSLDRNANAKTYPEDHPQHGVSIYDPYIVQMFPDEDGKWWLYVTPRDANLLTIEGLSETPPLMDAEGHEVHQLEDHSNGQT